MNYCPACALELRRLRLWCPSCRRPTASWLHVLIAASLDAAIIISLLTPA